MRRLMFSNPNGSRRPLFHPVRLGDKYPTADLLVDLLDQESRTIGFFYVQVKTASMDATGHLSVSVNRDEFNALVRLPIPAYFAGVGLRDDGLDEELFLLPAHDERDHGFRVFPQTHSLREDETLVRLFEEVRSFWRSIASVNRGIPVEVRVRDA